MEFRTYNTQALAANPELIDSFLGIMSDNLSWLLGPEMNSEENRNEWIRNNLKCDHPILRAVAGFDGSEILGFIHYSTRSGVLVFHEFEIEARHRHDPALIRGLLRTLFHAEKGNFSAMRFYINSKNPSPRKTSGDLLPPVKRSPADPHFLSTKERPKSSPPGLTDKQIKNPVRSENGSLPGFSLFRGTETIIPHSFY